MHNARIPESGRQGMEAYKLGTIYPHIHSLYSSGAYEAFLERLRNGDMSTYYGEDDFPRARRVFEHWLKQIEWHSAKKAAVRREREKEREARRASDAAAGKSSDEGGGGRGLRGRSGGKSSGKRRGNSHRDVLPGGLHMQICLMYQLMPGPETRGAYELLKDKAEAGELKAAQEYTYYLDVLKEAKPDGLAVE